MYVDLCDFVSHGEKVIISGLSSPAVLTPSGFVNYARAIGLQATSILYLFWH